MSDLTNITYVGPSSSCQFLAGRAPSIWKETNSTDAACSVANCGTNSVAIEKCCIGGTVKSLNDTIPLTFSDDTRTIDAQYLYCALPGVNASQFDPNGGGAYQPDNPYQAYQDCLIREGAIQYLTCNQPGHYTNKDGGVGVCYAESSEQTYPLAQGIGENASSHPSTVCYTNTASETAPQRLFSCCESNNGTLRAEQFGCQASCTGNYSVKECLKNHDDTEGYWDGVCYNYTRDDKASGAAVDADVGGRKITLVGVLTLSAVLFAVL